MLNQSQRSIAITQGGSKIADELKENVQIYNIVSTENPLVVKFPPSDNNSVPKSRSNKFVDISDFNVAIVYASPSEFSFNLDEQEEQLEEDVIKKDIIGKSHHAMEDENHMLQREGEILLSPTPMQKIQEQIRKTSYELITIKIPSVFMKEVYDKEGNPSSLIEVAIPKTASQQKICVNGNEVILHHIIYGLSVNPTENIDIGQLNKDSIEIQFSNSNGELLKFSKPYCFRFKLYEVQVF